MAKASQSEAHVTLDLGNVQRSLRQLWSSEALRGAGVVRAETHNLVICGGEGRSMALTESVIDLGIAQPGRVIVIDAGPGEPLLVGSASVYCREEEGKQLCGEIITLRARGSASEDAHSAVASLLLPDLPVYVWWHGMLPQADHLFEQLAALADRTYFDSGGFDDPVAGLTALARLSGRFPLGDLNWSRLLGWRQLLAQIYDVRGVSEAMRRLRAIDVHYIANQEPYNPNRALLLVGWLAARLGWSVEEARVGKTGGYIFHFGAGERLLKVEVVEGHASNLDGGELTGVFIEAGGDAPYVMPRVVMGESHDCLEMRIFEKMETSKSAPVHVIPYTPWPPTSLLAGALLAGGDPDYAGALDVAGRLLATVK